MLGICSCVSCTLETCSLRIEGDVVALHWLRTHLEPNHSVCSFKKKRKGIIMGSVMLFHILRVPTFQQSCLSSCCHSSVCVPLRLFYFCLTWQIIFFLSLLLFIHLSASSPRSPSLPSLPSLSFLSLPNGLHAFSKHSLSIINLSLCLPPPSFRLLPRLQDRFPQE